MRDDSARELSSVFAGSFSTRSPVWPAALLAVCLGACHTSGGTDQNDAGDGGGGGGGRAGVPSGSGASSSGSAGGAGSVGSAGSAGSTGGASGAAGVGGNPGTGGTAAGMAGGAGSGGSGGATGSGGSRGAGGGPGTGGSRGAGGSTAAGGASGLGGNPGTGGSAAGATGGQPGTFVLSWQDDFNTLDTAAWQLQSFSFTGNQAQFTPQNAAVANGILTISLTPDPTNALKPYRGVEMRSSKTLTYGKVSARMRFAKGSGVVSGLVLFYTPFPNCNWNEIDIEHLGASSNSSQLNCQVFLGTPMQNCTTSVTATQDPLIVNLGLDAEADFHQYDIEWTPAGVTFLVDGTLLRTWNQHIALMNLPQTILLTIWASSTADWAGPLLANSAPTSADVDWIKVYSWQN